MKKISIVVKKIAEAIVGNLSEDEVKKLEAGEVDDDFLATVGDKVLNSLPTYQTNTKKSGRQELYTKLDEKVFSDAKLGEILGTERLNKIKGLKGSEKVIQLHASYLEAIDALKKAKQGADSPTDANAYAEQLRKVTEEFDTFKTESENKLSAREKELLGKYNEQLLREKLFNKLQSVDLADSYKTEKAIRRMVMPEILEVATKKGVQIDPENMKVSKTDGTPLFANGGKEYTIDDLIQESVTEEWRKKGEPASSGIVTTTASPKQVYVTPDPVASQVRPMVAAN